MHRFTVWAPNADRVDIVLKGERLSMRRVTEDAHDHANRGWWAVEAETGPGDRYAFSLDGGDPRPDPRSRFQPDGVHGASQLVGHDAYEWRSESFRAAPLSAAVIYELHLGTFTAEGTLDAAAKKLDHLVSLGVTHVELMPVNAFDGEHGWGYDGVCWYAPHRAYTGADGPDALKRFVDACHEAGLAVVLDVVYNHLGPSGNYLGEFGPYFTEKYHTPWGAALNLDGEHSDHVRRHIIDNALMWLRDYRIDGLRVDAVHALLDRSTTHLLQQLRDEVDMLEAETGRPNVLIAESDQNDPRMTVPRSAHGVGMHAQWSDDFHHALHALVTGERDGWYYDFGSIGTLAKAIRSAFVHDGTYSTIRGRTHGAAPLGADSSRFLAYIQNHDQIGNRAQGDRINRTISLQELKTCAALTLLSPYVPMLFQGEEWGASTPFQYFSDHQGEGLAEAVRTGRRNEFKEFGWKPDDVPDPQDVETFRRSKLDWSEVEGGEHADLLKWHRSLLALRKATPGLSGRPIERTAVTFDEGERWLVMRNGPLAVACSFAEGPVRAPAPEGSAILLASSDECVLDGGRVALPAGGCAVLEAKPDARR